MDTIEYPITTELHLSKLQDKNPPYGLDNPFWTLKYHSRYNRDYLTHFQLKIFNFLLNMVIWYNTDKNKWLSCNAHRKVQDVGLDYRPQNLVAQSKKRSICNERFKCQESGGIFFDFKNDCTNSNLKITDFNACHCH